LGALPFPYRGAEDLTSKEDRGKEDKNCLGIKRNPDERKKLATSCNKFSRQKRMLEFLI
jgi:hypothetical protein